MEQAQEALPVPLVPRSSYAELDSSMDNKQVIIISGIRRCGKSTLMQFMRRES